ncbi:MAG TPA: hypothetical protein DIT99_18315 [Candidatus Latescibacteria bacterium]|nr:hypothetical protein [Candidatus Latescibacterota bacterium]
MILHNPFFRAAKSSNDAPGDLFSDDRLKSVKRVPNQRVGVKLFQPGVACITYGPAYIRRLFRLAECTGLKCLIGTDQESTLGIAAQLSVAVTVPDLDFSGIRGSLILSRFLTG